MSNPALHPARKALRPAGPAAALLITALALGAARGEEPEPAAVRAQLREISERIRLQERVLVEKEGEAGRLRSELRELDLEIQNLTRETDALHGRLQRADEELHRLARRREELEQRLERSRSLLARTVAALHRLERGGLVRVLLTTERMETLGRTARHVRELRTALTRRLRRAAAELRRAAELEAAMAAQRKELELRRRELDQARARRVRTYAQRQDRLTQLQTLIAASKSEVRALETRRQALEALLQELEAAVENLPTPEPVRFAQLRGRLPWPAEGRVHNLFGRARGATHARWRGALILAPLGSPVHAVARGRVVYADWFRGYGLLVIVDHGDGYMSLYGYNQAIFKSPGEWVEAGERIASVGMSGLRREPGVYFELRRHGVALDPGRWCTKPSRTAGR